MARSAACCGNDGVFRSPRPPVTFPSDPHLSLTRFLLTRTARFPEHPALVDAATGETITFSGLRSSVMSYAAALSSLISPGDVVLIVSPNSILYPIVFLSVSALAAVVTTANPVYTVPELRKQVSDSGARLVFTVPELYPKVAALNLPTILLGDKVSDLKPSANLSYFSDLVTGFEKAEFDLSSRPVNQDDTAALLYSSGTTGTSKGVILSHRNFITTALMVTADQDMRKEPPNVFLCFLPMFHIFGLSVITLGQMCRANCIVALGKFNIDVLFGTIERFKVTYMFCVPPVMIALAKVGRRGKYDLSSLKFIGSGAAPLGKEVMTEVAKKFPDSEIVQGYGMTETCGIISLEYTVDGVPRQYGSTGKLVYGVEVKIIDVNTSKRLPPGQEGEICVRGPNIMQGYLNNAKDTGLTLKQGWLHTGDLGYFDEDGQLFVVDRLKELIKYKGFQVAPAELESVLLSHPDILDAVVIPLPDEEAGEVPIGYVVKSPKSSLTEEDVQKFVADQVAPFKKLKRVTFVTSVPKSTSGKILRRELIAAVRSKL